MTSASVALIIQMPIDAQLVMFGGCILLSIANLGSLEQRRTHSAQLYAPDWTYRKVKMKEVKLVSFSDLTSSDYWSREYSDEDRLSQYEKNRQEEAKRERPLVEQRLADFLNDGWIIAGIGGDSLKSGFVILVRER